VKPRRYFLLAVILLVILGVFLTLGIINSRKVMMDLIKEEAHSFLAMVASIQENSIFTEGKFEDGVIEKLINICNYLGTATLDKTNLEKIRQNFNLNSLIILDARTRTTIASSGYPLRISNDIFAKKESVFFEYFTIVRKKYMHFAYRKQDEIFQIEVSAEEIETFRQQFGINKIIDQIALNPMIEYLVLQDQKGIIFATPNIQNIGRIDDDSMLINVLRQNIETNRIARFANQNILELVRPFVIDGRSLGLFRMGINLESYYHHRRVTERQLILLFIILFGVGFALFFLFMKYQSYIDLKELFTKTLGAVEDGVLMVDSKGTITGANKMFANIVAFEENVLLGQNYFSSFEEDPFNIHKVLKDGAKIVNERLVSAKNIQYATYPLLDEKNRITGAISVLRDVTKIREFEKEREEAERLKFLGNLVANFAHEIKNPLNGLSIATQRIIKEFPSGNEEYFRLTTAIKREIESLNRILNDFLSLARPKIKEKGEFDLSSLTHQILDLMREEAKSKNIILKENISKDIKYIGIEEDFKRAILNILLNGIDTLTNISDRERALAVQLTAHDNSILLAISDNGEGMDKKEIEKIFTPYFTTKKGGTGLGLYIAQQILKDHKAEIIVESEKGAGTTFKIILKNQSPILNRYAKM